MWPLSLDLGSVRNYERKNFNKSLALASGQWLQATSGKLQATSCKLDKKEI